MQEQEKPQVYVTLAQSTQSAYQFRPVRVDHRGVQSLPVAHRGRSTIQSMATVCKLYAWRYGLPVLFSKHLATLPIPAEVMEQLRALVDDEVEAVLR